MKYKADRTNGKDTLFKNNLLPRFGMILTLELELVKSEPDFAKGEKIHVCNMDKDFTEVCYDLDYRLRNLIQGNCILFT